MVDAQLATLIPGPEMDLGGFILSGMGETLEKLMLLSGTDKPVVDLGHGTEFTIGAQDPWQSWRDRLTMILEAVCVVVEANPSLDTEEVSRAVLTADGWSWTRVTFRTPLWMLDHDEILRSIVAQDFEEMGWLVEKSSSEIK